MYVILLYQLRVPNRGDVHCLLIMGCAEISDEADIYFGLFSVHES